MIIQTEHNKGRYKKTSRICWKCVTARNEIRDQMFENNQAGKMYDFFRKTSNVDVERCVVKVMDNQWFLRYSDEEWTNTAKKY